MKKLKYLVAPLLLVAVLLAGCGKTDVVGTWTHEAAGDVDLGADADEYVFSDDNTYTHSSDSATIDSGEYKVDGNKIKLDGKYQKYTLVIEDNKKFKKNNKTYEKKDE